MKRKVLINSVLIITAIFIFGFEEGNVISETPEVIPQVKEEKVMSVKTETFGKMPDGTQVDIYTLTNPNGLRARITNYGAILVSMEVPDRNGNMADVTLGFGTALYPLPRISSRFVTADLVLISTPISLT